MAYKYPYDSEEKEPARPKLSTNRSMWKFMILSLLTFGIYSFAFFIPMAFDLEKINPQGKKLMNYIWAYFLALLTMSIVIDIWHYQLASCVSEALEARNIDYGFGTEDFWKWFIFGSFILVGPFVYFHKLCKAMNLLCEHYNENPVVTAE